MTTPGNAAWLSASPMKASPRSTMYVPTTAQTTPTIADAMSARTKNWNCSGSVIAFICARSRRAVRVAVAVVVMHLPVRLLIVVMRVVEDGHPVADEDEMPAVRLHQHVLIEDEGRRALRDDRPVDRDDVREMRRRGGKVVGAGHDRLPALRLVLQDLREIVLGRG